MQLKLLWAHTRSAAACPPANEARTTLEQEPHDVDYAILLPHFANLRPVYSRGVLDEPVSTRSGQHAALWATGLVGIHAEGVTAQAGVELLDTLVSSC